MNLELTSAAWREGQPIPAKYTGDGRDLSPPLKWHDPPENTQSFALICEDPDAPRGTYTHWVIFNIPSASRELPEGVPPEATLPDGAIQGKNDFGKIGYGGPAPPPGKPHRYFFKLFALDTHLDLKAGTTKPQLEKAVAGDHVLATGTLMGTYGRQKG
jgi:Raf kinase inhibitor-like YbhB/YbcL family protein